MTHHTTENFRNWNWWISVHTDIAIFSPISIVRCIWFQTSCPRLDLWSLQIATRFSGMSWWGHTSATLPWRPRQWWKKQGGLHSSLTRPIVSPRRARGTLAQKLKRWLWVSSRADKKQHLIDLFLYSLGILLRWNGFLPGLKRWATHRFNFPDYSGKEIILIFKKMCDRAGLSVGPQNTELIAEQVNNHDGLSIENVGFAGRLLASCKMSLNARLSAAVMVGKNFSL